MNADVPDAAVEAGARAVHSLTVQGHKDFRLMSGSWRGRFLAESSAVLEAASETIACPSIHAIFDGVPQECGFCGGSGVLHILKRG